MDVSLPYERMKPLTRQQLESRKARAVRFTRDIRDDPDRADEIADESLDEYAERKRIKLVNPRLKGATCMATPTRRELLERIEQLESENEDLQSRLDEVADIVAPPEDEDEDEDQGE